MSIKLIAAAVCALTSAAVTTSAQAAVIPLTNGDFEDGATGFTTDYNLDEVFLKVGDFWIDKADLFGWTNGVGDKTTGSGNMAMYNASTTPGAILWGQTLSLVAGMTYEFTGWVNTITSGPPVLQLLVNGVSVGDFAAPDQSDAWFEFTFFFTATGTGLTTLGLTNTNLNPKGVDFALDELGLASVDMDDVLVNPIPAALPLFLTALGLGGAAMRRRKKTAHIEAA